MTDEGILRYSIGDGVEAFTTTRSAQLPYPVIVGHQVHGNKVALVDRSDMTREDLDGYDALVTNLPVAIGVRTADCMPILLYDPVHKAVAAVHSGWKSTVQKIALYTVSRMASEYGTSAADLKAVIGPGISRRNFQVREDVSRFFKEAGFPIDRIWSWDGTPDEKSMRGGHHIDLEAANKWLLESTGVRPENIQSCGICTYDDLRFFSARREGTACGRNISAIRLENI